jgi:glycosyltransferase involved in cell wall biosynthesis
MYKQQKIAVVVPAYKEEELIGETLLSIPKYVDKVYAVDDGSPDRTYEIIQKIAEKDSRIVPIKRKENGGVGAAIVTGYKKALQDKMDIAVVMAGDNQMDPAFMPALLAPIVDGKADYAKGNRLLSPEYRGAMNRWRFFGNAILTFLTKIASGYWQLIDPQNGYTAISRRALERIDLDSIYPWYGYCNDILVKLNVLGFKVVNVLHPARYGREKSKIKYSEYIFKVSWLLLRDFFWRLKMKYIILSFNPLVFFYLFGLILTPIGFALGLWSLYMWTIYGASLFIRGTLSMLVFIIGLQFLLFAMLFDMQNNV